MSMQMNPLSAQPLTMPGYPTTQLSPEPNQSDLAKLDPEKNVDPKKVREAFDDFVGQTFFGQMLSAMRKTVDKPAYFHGGHAEEIFQGQLDQVLAEELSHASANSFTDPMFELFNLQRP